MITMVMQVRTVMVGALVQPVHCHDVAFRQIQALTHLAIAEDILFFHGHSLGLLCPTTVFRTSPGSIVHDGSHVVGNFGCWNSRVRFQGLLPKFIHVPVLELDVF